LHTESESQPKDIKRGLNEWFGVQDRIIIIGMENNNEKDFKKLSQREVRALQLAMRHFFINYPQENLKDAI
jgi:hypothetical protein